MNKAQDLEKKADKVMKKWVYLGDRYEDARELYEQSANLYKMSKDYEAAAGVYEKLVVCYGKQSDCKYECATELVNAAAMFKKFDKKKAIPCYERAVSFFIELGKFANAGKYEVEIAEIYEELKDQQKAAEHYMLAKDYYENEDSSSNANNAYAQYAHLKASLGEYESAIEAFETCGNACLDDKLLKWGAKEHFFKAGICRLALAASRESLLAEHEEIGQKFEEYNDLDVHFGDSYEYTLLTKMISAIEKEDPGAFTAAIKEFDSVKKLVPWLTTLLLKIKKALEQEEDDLQ